MGGSRTGEFVEIAKCLENLAWCNVRGVKDLKYVAMWVWTTYILIPYDAFLEVKNIWINPFWQTIGSGRKFHRDYDYKIWTVFYVYNHESITIKLFEIIKKM